MCVCIQHFDVFFMIILFIMYVSLLFLGCSIPANGKRYLVLIMSSPYVRLCFIFSGVLYLLLLEVDYRSVLW